MKTISLLIAKYKSLTASQQMYTDIGIYLGTFVVICVLWSII